MLPYPFLFALAFAQPPTTAMPNQIYSETYRPQFHFSPKQNWLNDPNGLVYYKGTWHLFYQYCAELHGNGDKYWGYATSPDLVHWKEHDLAFGPDKDGAVWSGGAAVDWENATGFGKNGKPPLVGMYTASAKFTQCLVYSPDEGKTWQKYPDPVIGHIVNENRDPRPVWYKPTKSWVVAVYLDGDEYAFFGSKDMKSWTELSRLHVPGSGECPELFEMPVEGAKGETRWVFYGGNYRYLIGTFDGRAFTPEVGPIQGDFGDAFYASQTWSDGPNGRRVQVAWMPRGDPFPGMNFTGQMSFPCDLTLRKTADGLRIYRLPVHEIAKLRKKSHAWSDVAVSAEKALPEITGDLLDLDLVIDPSGASECGAVVRGVRVTYSVKDAKLRFLGREADMHPVNGKVKLRILVDRVSIEVFGSDGAVSMTSYLQPEQSAKGVALFADGGTAKFQKVEGFELASAW